MNTTLEMNQLIFTPGFYTKIRLDQFGNIQDAMNIEALDLPVHKHELSEFDKKEFANLVKDSLNNFFPSTNIDNAVTFEYDAETRTVTADVRIDGDTIRKNEYGQLYVASGSGTASVDVDIENLKDELIAKISDIDKVVNAHILTTNLTSGLKIINDNELKANIDNYTLIINEQGEICVNTDVIKGGDGSGSMSTCATHYHEANQIDGLEDLIKKLISDNSTKINAGDIPIDGTTIIINNQGMLSAVSSGLVKHTHTLSDITDYIAPAPAVLQNFTDLSTEYILKGLIDLETTTVGGAITYINYYLANDLEDRLKLIEEQIKSVALNNTIKDLSELHFEPGKNAICNMLTDTTTGRMVKVYKGSTLYFELDYDCHTSGTLNLYQDGTLVRSVNAVDLQDINDPKEGFTVTEFYKIHGVKVKVLTIKAGEIAKDGIHTFYLEYVSEDGQTIETTRRKVLSVSAHDSYNVELRDKSPSHELLGKGAPQKKYYDSPFLGMVEVAVQGWHDLRYVNLASGFNVANGKMVITTGSYRTYNTTLHDLFTDVPLYFYFETEPETSKSKLYSYITSIDNAYVLNDLVTQVNEDAPIVFTLSLPDSNLYNSVKITHLNDKASAMLQKHFSFARKGDLLDPYNGTKSGELKTDLPETTILSLYDGIDNGRDDLELAISFNGNIDLNKLNVELMQIKPY